MDDERQSLSAQVKQDQRRALEMKLAVMERKHRVPLRWIETDTQYQAAAGQRKRFMIRRLHAAIASRFLDHFAAQRQLDTAAYRERTSLKRLRRQMEGIVSRVGDDILQLQRWHAAPGDYYGPVYPHHQLTAAGLLASDTLPWQRQTAAEGLLVRKVAALAEQRERRTRCMEEMAIIRREARDMEVFYRYYTQQVERALAQVEDGVVNTREVPGAAQIGSAGVTAMRNAFRAGQVQVLQAKLLEYRHLANLAYNAVEELHANTLEPSDSSSDFTFQDARSDATSDTTLEDDA